MGFLDILLKIIQLLAAIFSLWKNGGAEAVKSVLNDSHVLVCDEQCKADLKRASQTGNK